MRGLRRIAAIVSLAAAVIAGPSASAQPPTPYAGSPGGGPSPYGRADYGGYGYGGSYGPGSYGSGGYGSGAYGTAGYGAASGSLTVAPSFAGTPNYGGAAYFPDAAGSAGAVPLPRPNAAFQAEGYGPLVNDRTGISYYDPLYSQTYVGESGLWESVTETQPRQFFMDLDFLSVETRRPDGLIGQRGALDYVDLVGGPLTNAGLGFFVATLRGQVNSNGIPDTRNAEARPGNNYFSATTAGALDDITGPGVQLRFGFENPDQSSFVMSVRWADTSGGYNAEHDLSTRQGKNRAVFEAALASDDFRAFDFRPLTLNQVFEQNLFNLNGLPLDDGTLNDLGGGLLGGGVTAPYDLAFNLNFRSEQFSAGLQWYLQPIYQRDWIRVRPIIGARYMLLREEFSFFGRDSGLYYDNQDFDDPLIPDLKLHSIPDGIDQNGDDIVDNAATVEGGQGGGGGGGGQGGGAGADPCAALQNLVDDLQTQIDDLTQTRDDLQDSVDMICEDFGQDSQQCIDAQAALDVLQTQLNTLLVQLTQRLGDLASCQASGLPAIGEGRFIPIRDPLTSTLKSRAQSHLVGPEVGVAYEFGRKRSSFRVTGETRFGVLANIERVTVSGRNIGMTTRPGDFLDPTPDNPDPNAFSDKKEFAHVSPLLEQTISAQGQVFQYVPILRRVPLLKNAKFRVGYSVTLIWKVVNPVESIRWQGNPSAGLFPSVRLERDNWFTNTWNFGVHWDY